MLARAPYAIERIFAWAQARDTVGWARTGAEANCDFWRRWQLEQQGVQHDLIWRDADALSIHPQCRLPASWRPSPGYDPLRDVPKPVRGLAAPELPAPSPAVPLLVATAAVVGGLLYAVRRK